MKAFERIKENPKMIYLVRAVNEDNTRGFLGEEEYQKFKAIYSANPLEAIRKMNSAIKTMRTMDKRRKYAEEAVNLEILAERQYVSSMDFLPERTDGNETKRMNGIPAYILDGFVDMGFESSEINRGTREKIVVDKTKLSKLLAEAKRESIEYSRHPVIRCYELTWPLMIYDIEFAEHVAKRHEGGCIGLEKYLDNNSGVCRHIALVFKLFAQEMGLESYLIRGKGPGGELHAWNIAKYQDKTYLADATRRMRQRGEGNVIQTVSPMIISGADSSECYRNVKRMGLKYVPKKSEKSFFKYRRLE